MTGPVGGHRPAPDQFTVGIVDPNGVEIAHKTFPNTAAGFIAAIDLLTTHRVHMVGVEGSASWGAHVAIAVVAAGFDAREVPAQRSAAQRRSRRLDKTDVVDSIAVARALLAEPSLGPVQALEVYDPLVAKIEAVLEHRRALVATRTLLLHHVADQIAKLPTEIRDQLDVEGQDRIQTASPRDHRPHCCVNDGRRLSAVMAAAAHRPRPPSPPGDPPTRAAHRRAPRPAWHHAT